MQTPYIANIKELPNVPSIKHIYADVFDAQHHTYAQYAACNYPESDKYDFTKSMAIARVIKDNILVIGEKKQERLSKEKHILVLIANLKNGLKN